MSNDELILSEIRSMKVVLENEIRPQLKALAEGQKTILETLSPKTEVKSSARKLNSCEM